MGQSIGERGNSDSSVSQNKKYVKTRRCGIL
jgi:hypothetical protein